MNEGVVRAFPSFPPQHLRRTSVPGAGVRPFPFDGRAVHAFRFARTAIHRGLALLGVGAGDAVLMPEYHHGCEVETVRSLGAEVVYYPLESDLTVRPEVIERAITRNTKVVFVVHYFGFPQPVRELRRLCRARGLVLFEDCSLALLSADGNVPLGSTGDAAAFCLYKTLPVPDGGLLVLDGHKDVAPARATRLDGRLLAAELVALARPGAPPKRRAPSGIATTPARTEPHRAGYPFFDGSQLSRRISPVTSFLLPRLDLALIRDKRRWNYAFWAETLGDRVQALHPALPDGVCPLLFPLLVEDKARLHELLLAQGLEVHNWWGRRFGGAREGELPRADRFRRELIGLPVHQDLTVDDLERLRAALVRHLPPQG